MKKNNILKKACTRAKKVLFWTSISATIIGNFLYTRVISIKENEENGKTS
jgi:hypothetical protein